MEYLVTMTTRVPAGTAEAQVDDVRAREAAHSRELAAQGHLLRLWLSDPQSRPLLQIVRDGRTGRGVHLKGVRLVAPLDVDAAAAA